MNNLLNATRSGSFGLRAVCKMALRAAGVSAALGAIFSPVVFGQEGDSGDVTRWSVLKQYEFVNGRWFDGRQFQDATFYTVDGRLTKTRPAVVDERVDLNGGFVVPPFGEAHNHNVEGSWNLDVVIDRYLMDGVFYVKNPNSIREFTRQIATRINTPASLDAVFANAGLTSSGGHPAPLYEHVLRESRYRAVIGEVPAGWFKNRGYVAIDSEADFQRYWPEIMSGKPDFLKVYLAHSEEAGRPSQADGVAGRKGLAPSLMQAIVSRAHRDKLRVTAHVETAGDFRSAVSAGVDEIAHMPGWFLGANAEEAQLLLTDEDARLASRAAVTVVTTTVAMKPQAGRHAHHEPESSRHESGHGSHSGQSHSFSMEASLWPKAQAIQTKNLRLLHRHGVKLAIGSDHAATSLPEALHLHELGIFDNLTLLKLWCEATPRAIFPDRRIGRLEEGYEASLLVLRGNPIERFEAVTEIAFRMKQGHKVIVGKGEPWTH